MELTSEPLLYPEEQSRHLTVLEALRLCILKHGKPSLHTNAYCTRSCCNVYHKLFKYELVRYSPSSNDILLRTTCPGCGNIIQWPCIGWWPSREEARIVKHPTHPTKVIYPSAYLTPRDSHRRWVHEWEENFFAHERTLPILLQKNATGTVQYILDSYKVPLPIIEYANY